MDIAWEDRAANCRKAGAMIADSGTAPGDLVVLPEMFDTGFSLSPERTADTQGASAKFLAETASRHEIFLIGGITTIGPDGRGRNRALVFDPSGRKVGRYDKVHPFSFGREAERFTGGGEVTCFDWESTSNPQTGKIRICPTICYDLRFPELFRSGMRMGALAFAVIANWPSTRATHWRALAIARAIENQAFVLAVNRVGKDPVLEYTGGSLIVGPKGDVLGEGDASERVISAEIDRNSAVGWRTTFPALRDSKAWL
ncbi:MAG TPA: nitrilase-related carbon-nitrogen hydrolase [Phycisphaerales bacterium]|nr:nitrilase-related carbon-nitrogen hydrolase [Phycisphaerales bacterium]